MQLEAKKPGSLSQINQDPTTKASSMAGGLVPTITRHVDNQWADTEQRWFTPSEVLAMMGFASTDFPIDLPVFCSFQVDRAERGFPARKRQHMLHQAGNSMLVSCIGLFHVYRYAFVQRLDRSLIVASLLGDSC